MVAGLAFLSKKRFNPSNLSNQKQVWEAQQSKKQEQEKVRQRNDQLQRERDDEELARARGEKLHLKFMYVPPPGMEAAGKKSETDAGDSATADDDNNDVESPSSSGLVAQQKEQLRNPVDDITQQQPGDDEATAAFRRMFAAASKGNSRSEATGESNLEGKFGTGNSTIAASALQGSTVEANNNTTDRENLTALEKAVGRRNVGQGLTLAEQVARFPQLKNAPMAKGMHATDVNVNFKPLGSQLRNIRCLACGIWGHSRGDRECEMSGWDPFSSKNNFKAAAAMSSEDTSKRMEDAVEVEGKKISGGNSDIIVAKKEDAEFSGSERTVDSNPDLHRKEHGRRRHKHHRRKHRYDEEDWMEDKKHKRKKQRSRSSKYSDNSDGSSVDSYRDRKRRKKSRRKHYRSREDKYYSDNSDSNTDSHRRRDKRKRHQKHRHRRESKRRSRSCSPSESVHSDMGKDRDRRHKKDSHHR